MSLFHIIHNFKLEIYNKELGKYIRSSSDVYEVSGNPSGFMGLFHIPEKIQQIVFGFVIGKISPLGFALPAESLKIVNYCITNKYINQEWISCFEWYWSNFRVIQENFLYRSIDPTKYRELLKWGHTTLNQKESEVEGINKSEFIWAVNSIDKPWDYGIKNNPIIIIIIYDIRYFNQKEPYIWVKKDTKINWKDTIVAIVRVRFKY